MNKEQMAKLPVLQLDESIPEIKPQGNYSHITRKAEKFGLVKRYLETPYNERQSLPLFRRENKINRNQYLEIKYEIDEQNKEIAKQRTRDAQKWINQSLGKTGSMACPEGAIGIEDDPMVWWKLQQEKLNQAILDSAMKGNAQSQKLAKQLAGELVEKQEIRIGMTAEERARRLFTAEEQLKKEGYIDVSTGT